MAEFPRGIRYVSLYGALGYFVAAKRYMLALLERGVPLTWTPMVPGMSWGMALEPFSGRAIGEPDLDRFCNLSLEYDTVILHTPPDLYPRWAQLEKGRRLIGYAAWETDRVPAFWPSCLDGLDLLLVPSRWNRDVLLRCRIRTPIAVIPHIVPRRAAFAPLHRNGGDPFVFYATETWTARKNLDQAVRSYLETFRRDEAVLLIIKTFPEAYRQTRLTRLAPLKDLYVRLRRGLRIPRWATFRPDAGGNLQKIVSRYPQSARIELISGELSESEIADLHRRCDCYFSLTHGEGWGMGAFDAAAYGNPVIMTGWGGQAEYLDPDHAQIVGYDLVPARDDDNRRLYDPGQLWAEPRLADASLALRQVFENPAAAREKAKALQSRILAEFAPAGVIDRLLAVLGGI